MYAMADVNIIKVLWYIHITFGPFSSVCSFLSTMVFMETIPQ